MVMKEISNRRSVREYRDKAVAEKDIVEIIKAGQFAPTARHNQAVEFVVVKNQKIKDKIFEIVGQEFVKEAPVLIVPVTDKTKTNCSVQDLSVASENMFLQATALGLGTVWKALKTEFAELEEIKKLLGIPEQFTAINIIPLGYPEEKPVPHKVIDFDAGKIHKEKW
ncbi:MAG: nitroreductase family protein [Candidatus Pacebacteria bacterium]|nr:nitroreductase family protein [Candidatus Paceibacterota bacterium]